MCLWWVLEYIMHLHLLYMHAIMLSLYSGQWLLGPESLKWPADSRFYTGQWAANLAVLLVAIGLRIYTEGGILGLFWSIYMTPGRVHLFFTSTTI